MYTENIYACICMHDGCTYGRRQLCMSVCLSVFLSLCLSVCLSVCLCLSVCRMSVIPPPHPFFWHPWTLVNPINPNPGNPDKLFNLTGDCFPARCLKPGQGGGGGRLGEGRREREGGGGGGGKGEGKGGGGGSPAPIHRYTVPSSLPRSAYRRICLLDRRIGVFAPGSAYRRIGVFSGRNGVFFPRTGISATGVCAYWRKPVRRIGVSAYVPPPGHAPAFRRIGARRFCDTICRHADTIIENSAAQRTN